MPAAWERSTSVGPFNDCLNSLRPPHLAIAVYNLPGAAQAPLDHSLVSHTGAHAHAEMIPWPHSEHEHPATGAECQPAAHHTGRACRVVFVGARVEVLRASQG